MSPARSPGAGPKKAPGGSRTVSERHGSHQGSQEPSHSHETPLSASALLTKAAILLTLAALFANTSQLALSPVYGSIPASVWHEPLVTACLFLGCVGTSRLSELVPLEPEQLIPIVAGYLPLVQFVLAGAGNSLSPEIGAALTECLTVAPLLLLSAAAVMRDLGGLALGGDLPSVLKRGVLTGGIWAFYKTIKAASEVWLAAKMGTSLAFTRVGFEVLLAGIYAVLSPSWWLLLAVPALIHTSLFNIHVMTPMATQALNHTLISDGWMLLDRRESLTGYVSVIESLEAGFRVMRCDHSLLGGEWVNIEDQVGVEPVYGVFAMLEAVRLVKRSEAAADSNASALLIGLGVGTTPSALASHGIDTHVVEIDPAVHDFAARFFHVHDQVNVMIRDAVSYTAELKERSPHTYDYIVHDVFTGGAEPVDLFTLEFLQGLHDLLRPNGVVAINYAGDFSLPSPRIVISTIFHVFPTCRVFRESPPDETPPHGDYTNMVIFCVKSDALEFRMAEEPDFLQSRTRKMFLQPQHEVNVSAFLGTPHHSEGTETSELLARNNTAVMRPWQETSAIGHWRIMRTVLPAKVWNLW